MIKARIKGVKCQKIEGVYAVKLEQRVNPDCNLGGVWGKGSGFDRQR